MFWGGGGSMALDPLENSDYPYHLLKYILYNQSFISCNLMVILLKYASLVAFEIYSFKIIIVISFVIFLH